MTLVPRLHALATHEIDIKRSRFIATVGRTDQVEEARSLIDTARRAHPKARHHCSALIITQPGGHLMTHSSDDGEPSGTAGVPMLEVLRNSGLTNITAVVTRYFGGILLGTGGLVRAYSTAVEQTLPLLPRARVQTLTVVEAHVAPHLAGRAEAELRNKGLHLHNVEWNTTVTIQALIDVARFDWWNNEIQALTHGQSVFTISGATTVEVDVPTPSGLA